VCSARAGCLGRFPEGPFAQRGFLGAAIAGEGCGVLVRVLQGSLLARAGFVWQWPAAQSPRATTSSRQSASRARVRLVAPEGSELRASKRGAVWRRHATGRPLRASDRFQAAPEAPQGSSTDVKGTGSTRPRHPHRPGIVPNRYPLPGVIRLEFHPPWSSDPPPGVFGGHLGLRLAHSMSIAEGVRVEGGLDAGDQA
jgi:hypothetical protein